MNGPPQETCVRLPAAALRPFIRHYAGYHFTGLSPGTLAGLPSSCIDLIISLDAPIELLRAPDAAQHPGSYQALLAGLQDRPAIVRGTDRALGLHLFFTPFGARSVLGVTSADLASRVVDLSDIWGAKSQHLVDALVSARTWVQRFEILDRAFLARLRILGADPVTSRTEISWAWGELARAHGCVPVQSLAREIGWSRRHFGERFRDVMGVAPKSAARVFRFERACRLIKDHRVPLAQVAAACGYFDQSHLTREWHSLAGSSPQAWIARELPFLQDYEVAGRDTEPLSLRSVR